MTENRFWRFDAYPDGTDFEQALSLQTVALPEPQDGEVIIRNKMLSLDAGTRMWITGREDGYQPPLPLNTPMVGLGIGEVVASRHAEVKIGDTVRAFGQWADYSVVTPEMSDLRVLDTSVDDLRQYFGVLGMNGWTALWGIQETGQAKAGEKVLISAAAGSTGILACQIAKLMGCEVYATAGGHDKCRYLEQEFGVTKAFDYKSDDLAAEFAKIDGGFDVYFDNVGGPQLDIVLQNMALYGRIALCGLVAEYADEAGTHKLAQYDKILMKRLSVIGFFSPDFADQGDRLTQTLRAWYDDGQLSMPFDETKGLENMLTAYRKLFTGGNIGKTIVLL